MVDDESNILKENILTGYPNVISYECTKKIIEQMEKNICKIKIGKEQGTGFFCKIPFPDKDNMLPVFITNNHIINLKEDKIIIKIKEEKESRIINLNNRIKYTNKEYDITIIELKEKDNIKNYLELDDNIINDLNEEYIDKTISIIQYPEGELSVSYGILNRIYVDKKYNFNHKCSTKGGSSGSPILNINNKLIGIHKGGYNNKHNKGLFLNYPIKDFIELYSKNNNELLLKEYNSKYNLNLNIQDFEMNKWKNLDMNKLLKLIKDNFYQMNFDNKIQMKNLLESLFSKNISFENKINEFNYIKSEKKRIKFIYNNKKRFIIGIPNFVTIEELYSITSKYKSSDISHFILIYNNKILRNEFSFDKISNDDIIFVIEDILYPDNSYLIYLKNK